MFSIFPKRALGKGGKKPKKKARASCTNSKRRKRPADGCTAPRRVKTRTATTGRKKLLRNSQIIESRSVGEGGKEWASQKNRSKREAVNGPRALIFVDRGSGLLIDGERDKMARQRKSRQAENEGTANEKRATGA